MTHNSKVGYARIIETMLPSRRYYSCIINFLFRLLTVIFLLSFSLYSYSQQLFRNQSASAYIFNFPKHIVWPNESTYLRFNIVVISENPDLINELQKLPKLAKIKNKPIDVVVIKDIDYEIIRKAQVVFITKDKLLLYLKVFDYIEGTPILLVSENLTDKRLAMINLFDTKDNHLQFEINKANIINQNLTIDDEILFLGGTLIDVAELYRKSQQSLRFMQKELDQNQNILDSLNLKISEINSNINHQNNIINDQVTFIEKQKSELENQLSMVNSQKHLLQNQRLRLESQKDSIKRQTLRLTTTERELVYQKEQMNKGRDTLIIQQKCINEINKEIKGKTDELNQLAVRFTRQKQISIFFGIIILLVTILVILVLLAYRSNRRKTEQLNLNKIEIEKINEVLKTTNDDIFQKNKEITIALAKLKDTQNQLVQSEKMASLGVMTAGIAHELNNPVNFVTVGTYNLKRDFQDIVPILDDIKNISSETNPEELVQIIENKKNEYLFDDAYSGIFKSIDAIELGSNRVADIIKGLRNFSRLDKDEKRSINIHDSINDVLILLTNKYKDRVEIIKDFDTNIPLLGCIPGKINQVLMNIINNAIDAIEDSGFIKIRTNSNPDTMFISIQDNGIGMDQETLANIFDPFFTTKEIGKGIGLGLSITYGIVKEHNGEIEVKSTLGYGSEFIIKLPII